MIELNGIRFELTGDQFEIKGYGPVVTAYLVDGEYRRDQVSSSLIGQSFDGKTIRGVEMFLTDSQTDRAIGLLVSDD